MGDKCEIMRARAIRACRAYGETNGRQVGGKCDIMRSERQSVFGRETNPVNPLEEKIRVKHPESSGRRVADKRR